MHENKLNQLNSIEERLINELQTTLQQKQAAVDTLKKKSPLLKNALEPRQAYRYKSSHFQEDKNQTNAEKLAHLKSMTGVRTEE